METVKKAITKVMAYVVLSQALLGAAFCTSQAAVVPKPAYSHSMGQAITIKSTQYVWAMKKVNGVVYKRLFNRTTGQWAGDWIRA